MRRLTRVQQFDFLERKMEGPQIFEYLDYRAYLKDMFEHRKERHRFFSHRYFAQKANFSSSNFLHLVIKGSRNLTYNSLSKVADGFQLAAREREYFEYLVFMNQADSHDERDKYYKKMLSVKGGGEARKLEKNSYEYFSKWYFPVIREIATWGNRKLTAKQIAAVLNPSITTKEAKIALDLLQTLGLLTQDEEGRWSQTDRAVTTGPEVEAIAVTNYHNEMLRLSAEAIKRHKPTERDVSAVTVCIEKMRMKDIKRIVGVFHKRILELACEDGAEGAQVVQVNIQAFPLTK